MAVHCERVAGSGADASSGRKEALVDGSARPPKRFLVGVSTPPPAAGLAPFWATLGRFRW
jgi:hypothetical protein